jgi:FkbM family methyltransferase
MSEKKKVLVYCGTNHGDGFAHLINAAPWDHIYGFEANPTLFEKVSKMVAHDSRVKMYNAILSDTHGEEKDFYILDANGNRMEYSSSVVNVDDWSPDYEKISGNKITLERVVKLKTANLNVIMQQEGITEIDFLLTDLEGSDLLVLSTMKDWLKEKRIKIVQCEVEPDHMPCKYIKLDNKHAGFVELLGENYRLSEKYQDMPHYFSVDHRWVLV